MSIVILYKDNGITKNITSLPIYTTYYIYYALNIYRKTHLFIAMSLYDREHTKHSYHIRSGCCITAYIYLSIY